MVHEIARSAASLPRVIETRPCGSPFSRAANLSLYLTGCPSCVASKAETDIEDPCVLYLGARKYLAFSSQEDRQRRLNRQIMKNVESFFPLWFYHETTLADLDDITEVSQFDEESIRATWYRETVAITCGWPMFIRQAVDHYGPAVLLGSMDQVGCQWDEQLSGPQLVFRIN